MSVKITDIMGTRKGLMHLLVTAALHEFIQAQKEVQESSNRYAKAEARWNFFEEFVGYRSPDDPERKITHDVPEHNAAMGRRALELKNLNLELDAALNQLHEAIQMALDEK
jgi:hypothetical protein